MRCRRKPKMHMLLDEELEMPNCHTPSQNKSRVRIPAGFFANWFKYHGRSFPWREEDVSPFGVLLAEVLLKQTRAEMVAGVWPGLYRKYPNAALPAWNLQIRKRSTMTYHALDLAGRGLQGSANSRQQ